MLTSTSPRPANGRPVKINIISDIICPFCWIGERRLSNALSKLDSSAFSFQINWVPFQLDPSLPTPSVNKRERYIAKFGASRMQQMFPYLQNLGKSLGIEFNYPEGALLGNTLNAHKLVQLSKQDPSGDKQEATMIQLFKAHHRDGKDINSISVLVEVAKTVGLTLPNIEQSLVQDSHLEQQVKTELKKSHSNRNVTGVPHFVIENEAGQQVEISGAQDEEYFLATLKRIGVSEKAKKNTDGVVERSGKLKEEAPVCAGQGNCQ